jgi:hypothetical protein
MKKLSSIIILAIAFATIATSPRIALADASEQGCVSSGGQASGCGSVAVPEPTSLMLLGAGLFGVGIAVRAGLKRE